MNDTMKLRVESVRCRDLRPGDLFSTAGPEYWYGGRDWHAVGERVYIRTEAPCPTDQENEQIYRVEVVAVCSANAPA